jgi:hypothetical protein
MGFARLKADMCFETFKIIRMLHNDLVRKEKQKTLKTKIYTKREISQ